MSTHLKLSNYEHYILDCLALYGEGGSAPPSGDLRKVWRKLHRFGLLKKLSEHMEVYALTELGKEYRNEQDW